MFALHFVVVFPYFFSLSDMLELPPAARTCKLDVDPRPPPAAVLAHGREARLHVLAPTVRGKPRGLASLDPSLEVGGNGRVPESRDVKSRV